MKVTLESTDKLVTLMVGGVAVPARIWQGVTEQGVECHAYITRIAAHKDSDLSQFDRELQQHAAPRAELAAIPMRMILG